MIFMLLFLYFVLLGVVSTLDMGHLLSGFNPFELLNHLFKSDLSLYVVAGIIAADIVHVLLDNLWSFLRRII